MPRKFPTVYPDYDRQRRNDALFLSVLTGAVTVAMCVGAVGVSYAPPEPHQAVVATIFGIGALVFGWLTRTSLKLAIASHRAMRERAGK